MTQRTEPTVGTSAFNFLGFPIGGSKEVKTPEQLMNDALQGFKDAAEKMEEAQKAIDIQVAEHEAEIERRQKQLEAANESKSRLSRVSERFKELLA